MLSKHRIPVEVEMQGTTRQLFALDQTGNFHLVPLGGLGRRILPTDEPLFAYHAIADDEAHVNRRFRVILLHKRRFDVRRVVIAYRYIRTQDWTNDCQGQPHPPRERRWLDSWQHRKHPDPFIDRASFISVPLATIELFSRCHIQSLNPPDKQYASIIFRRLLLP